MHTLKWFHKRIGKTVKKIRIEDGGEITSYQYIPDDTSAMLLYMKQRNFSSIEQNVPKKHRYGNYRRTYEKDGVVYSK